MKEEHYKGNLIYALKYLSALNEFIITYNDGGWDYLHWDDAPDKWKRNPIKWMIRYCEVLYETSDNVMEWT